MDRKDDNPYAAPQSELHVAPVAQLATTYQPATVLSADIPRGPEWAKVANGAELFRLANYLLMLGFALFVSGISVPVACILSYVLNARALSMMSYMERSCTPFATWIQIAKFLHYGVGSIIALLLLILASHRLRYDFIEYVIRVVVTVPLVLFILETITLLMAIAAIHAFGKRYQIAYLQKYLKWDLLLITLMVFSFLALLILSQVGADRSLGDLLAGIFFISLFVQFILIRFHIHFAMYHLQNLARQLINSDTEIVITSTGAYSTLHGDEMSFLYPQAKRAPEPWHGPTIM